MGINLLPAGNSGVKLTIFCDISGDESSLISIITLSQTLKIAIEHIFSSRE